MKKTFFLIISILIAEGFLAAQGDNFPAPDKSPMDISYYPSNYPSLKIQGKINEPPVARVIYSRPVKNGRNIFGGLLEYGKVWRMGANEATELELFKNVRIAGKKLLKGRYSLYAIINETTWTIIISKDIYTWGLKYDPDKDLMRVEVPVQRIDSIIESLSMMFEKTATGCNLVVAWDNVRIALPLNF